MSAFVIPENRLNRRTTLLRGKRGGAFDRDQYYLEQAVRARIARKVRFRLRRMEPVLLVTPRWSEPLRFLDDVATDLQIGEPSVRARTLSVRPLEGRTPHQAWSWFVLAVTEFCALPLDGPAWKVVSRRGFRHVMRELFARAEEGERRCLLVHGLEHMHVEALRDLLDVYGAHLRERALVGRPPGRSGFNLLLAGAIDAPHFEIAGVDRIVLEDFSDREAMEALVEQIGVDDVPKVRSAVGLVGGIPAMLDVLGTEAAARLTELATDSSAIWSLLGGVATEVRRAFDIVVSDETLLARMERIARDGPQTPDPRDSALLRAGLVRSVGWSDRSRRTVLRAQFLADLADFPPDRAGAGDLAPAG